MRFWEKLEQTIGKLEEFKYELELRAYDREAHKEMIKAQKEKDAEYLKNCKLEHENKKLREENERLVKRLIEGPSANITFEEFIKDMEITKQNNIKVLQGYKP